MPSDHTVIVTKFVNQIGKLESTLTYNLSKLHICNGLRLNEVNFQPLKNLKNIYIEGNCDGDSQTVDLGIFKNLDEIESLSLRSNQISKVENSENECNLQKLKKFSFALNKLTTFDLGVIRCAKNLVGLNLRMNQIETIQNSSPDGACMWPDLKYLKLESNKLIHFEPAFFRCSKKLYSLKIGKNQLTSFGQKSACYWPDLEILNLNDNRIEIFNENILECSKELRLLRIYSNKLRSFGSISKRLGCVTPKLVELILIDNELTTFDLQQFSCAEKLYEVNLAYNKLKELTGNLNQTIFSNLQFFGIRHNLWKCPNLERIVTDLNEMNVTFFEDENCPGQSFGGICCN